MEKNNSAKTKRLFKDVFLFSISTFGSKILIFLLTPLYTAVLATEEYGIVDLITTTINLIYPILTLSIAESALRFALDSSEDKNKVFCISLFFTIISVVFLLTFYPLLNYLDSAYKDFWWIFVFTYFLFNLHNTFSYFIKGLGMTKLFAVQGIVYTIVFVSLNIIFLVALKWGLNGYLWSTIISFAVSIVLMFFFGGLYKYFSNFKLDANLLKRMLRYCTPMIPVLIGTLINNNIDRYMIIGMVGLGESGVYGVAHKIPSIYLAILSVFVQAWQISAIENKDDDNQSAYFTSIYKAADFVSVLGCISIIILCKYLALFLFSNDYYIGWEYVPMLTLAAMFMGNANIVSAAFRAEKKTALLFVSVVVGCVVNVVLNYIFILYFGVLGAAVATAISSFVIWLIRIITVQRIIRIKIGILNVIASYAVLITCAVFTMLEIKYWLIIDIIGIIIILAVNTKEVIYLIKKGLLFLTKNKKDKKVSTNK